MIVGMSELIEVSGDAGRRSYKPEPCRVCGDRVRVVGWNDVSTAADAVQKWSPDRRCLDPACDSNGGSAGSPPA